MMFDTVIVGSGINSLICAAMLGKRGHSVCLLERNDRLGGTIRTEALTLPGYSHDVMACWYPLFVTSPGYAALSGDLARHGLRFVNSGCPSGVLLPDGRHAVLSTDREANAATFDAASPGDGARYLEDMAALEKDLDLIFTLLGSNPWSAGLAWRMAKEALRRRPIGLSAFMGDAMTSARDWLSRTYQGDMPAAMFAPWVLHTGLAPDSRTAGLMARVIAYTLEAAGMPVVEGGGSRLVDAFAGLIAEQGGICRTNAEVARVVVDRGRATGVELADGTVVDARRAVVCNVAPPALYNGLLADAGLSADVRQRARNYRFGRAGMQIHLALSAPAPWAVEALGQAATVHLTDGIDGVNAAVGEAERGLLPRRATIVVGQPAIVDTGRVPAGAGQLWIQLQELPSIVKGDAAGTLRTPADGRWTDDLAERYADRIVARLEQAMPGLSSTILARRTISPAGLEGLNGNLVGGDPYCGDCGFDQFAMWRPFAGARGHRTPIDRLFHIGASTHPGPGLGGVSGFLAAQAIG